MKKLIQILRSNLKLTLVSLIVTNVSVLKVYSQALNDADYRKALWMTTRFYGAQRSGDNNWLLYNHLPNNLNVNLKGKAFRSDADGNIDLSGGWHDCGDHVKFGQTQFYSAYVLLKGYAEFKQGYDDFYSSNYAGYTSQSTAAPATGWTFEGNAHDPNGIPDILDEVKHATDFFIKCTPNATTFYYQIGDGGGSADHATNNTAVYIQSLANNKGGNNDNGVTVGQRRPTYKNPADGAMPSLCAATLALMSRMYEPFDPDYAALCLKHAGYAYTYASNNVGRSVSSGGFYPAHDNAHNPWAICLSEMFLATKTNSYKNTALALSVGNSTQTVRPNQGYSMDYSNVGELAQYTLAQIGHPDALAAFNARVTGHFLNSSNYSSNGNYSGGGGWGQLRYTANAAFVIGLYKKINKNANLDPKIYGNIDYILGANSAKRSFVVGYEPTKVTGVTSPKKPHHRNLYLKDNSPAGGDFANIPIPDKNKQFGALVGGNKTNPSSYSDTWTEYVNTEVCIDYNAGLVGALGAINASKNPIDTNKFLSKCAAPGDLGGDKSLCGSTSIVLNTGLVQATNRKFEWFKDEVSQGVASSSANSKTITQGGVWKVVVDSLGCKRTASVTISATLPTVNLGSAIELCKPATTTLDAGASGNGISYKWEKNNVVLANTTKTLNVTESGTYKVTVSASGCASQSGTVVVTSKLPTVKGDTICASGKATLQVTSSGGPFNWYADATTSTILATGTTYQPTISATKTFYVIDGGSFSTTVGPNTFPSTGVNWGVNSGNHLKFTVLKDFTIEALKVSYGTIHGAQTNATISIEVLDGNGNAFTPAKIFTSNAINITTTQSNSLVRFTFAGFQIKKSWGNNLRLRVSNHTNIGDLNWQSGGASYPYTATDIVSITGPAGGNNNSADYMYFYNWEVSSGASCDRAAVVAVVDGTLKKCTVTSVSDVNQNSIHAYPNPYNESFNLSEEEDIQFVEIYNSFGQFMERTSEIHELGSQLEKGTYILKIQTKDKLMISKIVKMD